MRRLLPVLVVALAGLLGCAWQDPDPMTKQYKFQAYRQSDFFADQRTMRVPPEGSVPRSHLLHPTAGQDGRDRHGQWLTELPIPIDRGLLDRGRVQFDIYCATCHGRLGDGDSPVAKQMALRPPPSLLRAIGEKQPGQVFAIITQGYGLMPAFAASIRPEERWAVIAWIRVLRRSQSARLEDAPPEVRKRLLAEPASGEEPQ